MENWEVIVEAFPVTPDLRVFTKMLKTAEVALNGDLAPFESDWIINTLFYKPVNLLETVTSNCHDSQWCKPICDAFKLISRVVEKYPLDYDNIITLCLVPYTPQIRKDALKCLTVVARMTDEAGRDVRKLVSELEEIVTGKAPLAVLIGTIAEYHPELVADEVHRIWRLFLNLLDSNKNTDTVVSAVLEGIRGLFKHFGQDLPIIEFKDLYTKISNEYIEKKGCEKECLQILEVYSELFKEMLSKDASLRERLWSKQESTALKSVYAALATAVDKQKLQDIIDLELVPRFQSHLSEVRFTALTVARRLTTQYGVSAQIEGYVSVPVVQQELNIGNITVDTANAILWCIESNTLHSDKLLQNAILFHSNIPSSKRRSIVVYGLLNASDDARKAAVTLLISESCQLTDSGHNIDNYLPLWTDLFDSKGGKDTVVLNKRHLVFGDVMEYLFAVLESVLDEGCETLPDKLSPLFTLTFHILTIYPQEEDTKLHCRKLLRLLSDCMHAATAPLLSAVVVCSQHAALPLTEYCAKIRVDKCSNEALLCECCLMLIQDKARVDADNVLEALQILFSRGNVDPRVLIRALQRLDNIMSECDDLDTDKIDHIIYLVSKLRTLKDKSNKDARILHKDVIIFLGKYGNDNYTVDKSKENSVIARLKDKLFLKIPNIEDGTTYKVNLQGILQLAIVHEDPDALQKLLAIICASLHNKEDPDLQLVLTKVVQASCRAHAHSSIQRVESIQIAVLLCRTVQCVCALLTAIGNEKSPGARKMLSDALEGSLLLDPGSELTELLVRTAADEAIAMMKSSNATTRSGGLNVTEALLAPLKDNHTLQKCILPELLTLILETSDFDAKDTFQNATKILLDSIQIYDIDTIKTVIVNLVKNVVRSGNFNNSVDVKLFKVKVNEVSCLMVDVDKFDDKVIEVCLSGWNESFGKVLYFMGEYKMALGVGVLSDVLERIIGVPMDEKGLESDFVVEAIMKFLEEYCDTLYETNPEMTTKAFSSVISSLHPDNVISLRKQLKNFSIVHQKHIKHSIIHESYKKWCSKYQVNSAILVEDCSDNLENINIVKAMRIYIELFNIVSYDDTMLQNICYNVLDFCVEKEENQLDTFQEYFADLLDISLKSLRVESIKKFFRDAYEKADVEFYSRFMSVFLTYLSVEPYVLLDNEMRHMSVLLKFILKEALKRNRDDTFYKSITELVNEIWPIFDPISTFEDKLYVLALAGRLPVRLKAESSGIRWAIRECIARDNIEDKIRLVELLPGGDACSSAFRSLASLSPARLSELSGSQHSGLRVMLDVLANTADSTLLNIVTNLADCDPSKGWWDDAMASSIASLARRDCLEHSQGVIGKGEDDAILMTIANTLFENPSLGVCHRLLIPLLRYSSPSFCERFYSATMNKLLATLNTWPRGAPPGNRELMKTMKEHARALAIITLAFEKVPLNSLKSADSPLYSQVANKQPSYLIKRACTLCYALRSKNIPGDATETLKQCHRQCLVENYRCFCAAVCVSRPAENVYQHLFQLRVWEDMLDPSVVYKLPLQTQWNKGRKLHMVAVNVPSEGGTTWGSVGSSTGAGVRSRLFLRTLSDDPLQYDLLHDAHHEENAQELELSANELNKVECIVPLTALVSHAARLTHYTWRESLALALRQGTRNTRWILAQVICNCKEELLPHASVLRPALLELVADTACEADGKRTLNGLHMDVLETILYFESSPLPESSYSHLSGTIEYLINTAIDNGHRTSIFGTLLSMLGKLAELYTERELPWNGFEECFAAPTKLKHLLSVLLVITKHKIHINNILPTLSNLDHNYWSQEARLSKLFGYALNCASDRAAYLSQHRRFLARRAGGVDYVKLVYYAQKGYPHMVDEAIFKTITDLTPKLVGTHKTWCLKILSSYVEHASETSSIVSDMFETIDICSLLQENNVDALCVLKHGCRGMGGRLRRRVVTTLVGLCSSTDVKIRRPAMEVALKIFQNLFRPQSSEPAHKRRKVTNDASQSLILSNDEPDADRVVECVSRGLTDADEGVRGAARAGVLSALSGNSGVRLAECFMLAISIPAVDKNRDVCVCVSAFLEMLLDYVRSQSRFQAVRLSEVPINVRQSPAGPSKLLTNSRTYHGTFLSVASRKIKKAKEESVSNGIDIQITINEILGTMIQFAKSKPDVAQVLCLQVVKSMLALPGSEFDARPALSRHVRDMLDSMLGELTPLAVEMARMLVDQVQVMPGFQNTLDKLKKSTKRTEGEALTALLWEDLLLRSGEDVFSPPISKNGHTIYMDVEPPPATSLDDITSAFGKLSDWDKLTIQARDEVKSSLPLLWVDDHTFKSWIDVYEVGKSESRAWFDKLVVTYREAGAHEALRWLHRADRWPASRLCLSAVAEAFQHSTGDEADIKLGGGIRPADCLVEWAARLMLRRVSSPHSGNFGEDVSLLGEQELMWCTIANDRVLPHLALDCIRVNTKDAMNAAQMLSWQIEKARALRTLGLDNKDFDMLKEALSILESATLSIDAADLDVILLNKLKLSIHQDIGSLAKQKVLDALSVVESHTESRNISRRNKQALFSLYELAMMYYDDIWSEEPSKCDLISNMAEVLGSMIDLDMSCESEMLLAVILNRLDDIDSLDEATSRNLLAKICTMLSGLNEFSLEAINNHVGRFPAEVVDEFTDIRDAVSRTDEGDSVRRCLQLVCDPRHSLSLRCIKLLKLNDAHEWKKNFDLMKANIFENPHAADSTEYSLLDKYRQDLYRIERFEETEPSLRISVLNKVLEDLSSKVTDRRTLRLSQLCPTLTHRVEVGSERDRCMSRLLRLGKLSVVKFYEQVSVFTSAINRPVVIRALLSDGSTRLYISKVGERLKLDAAAQTAARAGDVITGGRFQGYTVTPLGEDSGLIEYLEDNITLRELICSVHDIDKISESLRKSIISSSPMDKFLTLCKQIPAYTLRSAVENNCSSVEDFITKKQHFTETLCSLSLFGSIFGLGDRHLENILYIRNSGAACCVDWANCLQYGKGEIPPARITRNVLGMVDSEVLEAKLQNMLSALRGSHKLFINTVKLVFKWMGLEFLDKLEYVSAFVRGEATTYHLTDMSLREREAAYSQQLGMLADIFGEETKREYSVVEQVECLLRQCTHPRILSTTRDGWEAYI